MILKEILNLIGKLNPLTINPLQLYQLFYISRKVFQF